MNTTKDAIDNFCGIILTEKDYIEENLADEYIEQLDELIADLNAIKEPEKNQDIRTYILSNVIRYLNIYQERKTDGSLRTLPFAFDSGDNYLRYRRYFEKKYKIRHKNANLPEIFRFAFDYIQEVSEHYRIFMAFTMTHEAETVDNIFTKISDFSRRMVIEVAENTVNDVVKNKVGEAVEITTKEAKEAIQEAKSATQEAKDATREVKISSNLATEQAQKALVETQQKVQKSAQSAVELAVSSEMSNVTRHLSETSVTILSIFAGIVLTIVAGLFYSSSVINNINSADFYKLMSVSALVGFVCFNLLAIMFRYIEKIRTNGQSDKTDFNRVTITVSIILIVVMLLFGMQHVWNVKSTTDSIKETTTITTNDSKSQDVDEADEESDNESDNSTEFVE